MPSTLAHRYIHQEGSCTPVKLAFNYNRYVRRNKIVGGKEPLWTLRQLGADMQGRLVETTRQVLCKSFKASYPGFQDLDEAVNARSEFPDGYTIAIYVVSSTDR